MLPHKTPCHRHLQSTPKMTKQFHVWRWDCSVPWLYNCVQIHRTIYQKGLFHSIDVKHKYLEKSLHALYLGLLQDLGSGKVQRFSLFPMPPYTCIASPIINTSQQNGTFFTIDDSTLTCHNHPKSVIYISAGSFLGLSIL